MSDNRIIVSIEDKTSGGIGSSENGTTARADSSLSPTTTQKTSSSVKVKALAVATTIGDGAFQYVSSNIGRYTGDSSKQQSFNNVMQLGQFGVLAVVNPVLAVATAAVQGTTWALNESWRVRNETVALNQAQARAGYSISNPVVNRRVK